MYGTEARDVRDEEPRDGDGASQFPDDLYYPHHSTIGGTDSRWHSTVGGMGKASVSLRPARTAGDGEPIAFCTEQTAAHKYPRQVKFLAEIPKAGSRQTPLPPRATRP